MSGQTNDFLSILESRGFIHQCSDVDGLRAKLKEGVRSAYIGFDCTATSLHVGSLVQIMMLRWLQKCGHKPIVLMGGGTTRIGDPSGKDEARKVLSEETIEANKAGIQSVFTKFLTFGTGATDAMMVDNADWLMKLNYLDFLREVGRHFSVNRMMSFDSVKLRLEREQPLSFLEFNYMILQGYDFVELNRRYGTLLQMGGSDQWGNIVNGMELGRRMDGAELFALTSPLLTTSSGAKMGKTADGAVWLNADMLSPYDYWQFWRNTEDADVGKFLKLFTELSLEEIAKLEALEGAEINEAKKVLATEATALLHGREEAEKAAQTAQQTFESAQGMSADLPSIDIPQAEIIDGLGLLTVITRAGLATTNSEARRHVQGGAVKITDQAVNDVRYTLSEHDILGEGIIKLSVGRKKHVLLKMI